MKKFFITALHTTNILDPPASMLEGQIERTVPEPLKRIIPSKSFLKSENKPGVYFCYFPHNEMVYIGMSQNIANELRILRSSIAIMRL